MSTEEVTLQQALALLCPDGPPPAPLERIPIQGDASGRRYERLLIPLHGEASPPQPVVLMWLPPGNHPPDEADSGPDPTRLPFLEIQEFLHAGGLPVPEILVDLSHQNLVVLEDLGDWTLEKLICHITGLPSGNLDLRQLPGDTLEEIVPHYRKAVELLVDFQSLGHRRTVNAAPSDPPQGACIAFSRQFDRGLLRWELDHFLEYGLIEGAGAQPDRGQRDELNAVFDHLADRLALQPRELVHRDYQSKNLMVQGQKLVLIDFQDALLGTMVYDMVALLRDSYVHIPWSTIEELLEDFRSLRMQRGLPVPSGGELRELFLLQTIQRKLKDAGRFVFIDRVKGNSSFLKYFPSSLQYVAHAVSLINDPVVNTLDKLLSPLLPGWPPARP